MLMRLSRAVNHGWRVARHVTDPARDTSLVAFARVVASEVRWAWRAAS